MQLDAVSFDFEIIQRREKMRRGGGGAHLQTYSEDLFLNQRIQCRHLGWKKSKQNVPLLYLEFMLQIYKCLIKVLEYSNMLFAPNNCNTIMGWDLTFIFNCGSILGS